MVMMMRKKTRGGRRVRRAFIVANAAIKPEQNSGNAPEVFEQKFIATDKGIFIANPETC